MMNTMSNAGGQGNVTPETMGKMLWLINFVVTLVKLVRKGVSLVSGMRRKRGQPGEATETTTPSESLPESQGLPESQSRAED